MPINNAGISEALERLESKLDALNDKFTSFQVIYVERHQEVVSETKRAHTRIERVEKDLATVAGVLVALAIPTVLAVLGFLWQGMTNQVSVVP